jgi:hypothetical protein
MASELDARQDAEWEVLHDRVAKLLVRYGKIDFSPGADFWLVDENLGWWRQIIELHNLTLLDPAIIKQMQDLLADYPDWEILVRVVLDGQEDIAMGLIIANDEIIDDLQRDLLPTEFRNLTYPGSKRPKNLLED